MSGTDGGLGGGAPPQPIRGFEVLPANVALQPRPSGAWTNTPLDVVLPAAGIYTLDANVRCNLSGQSPLNTWIVARLWDLTAGAVVPDSEMLVIQQIVSIAGAPGAVVGVGGNQNASLAVEYQVTGPTTIRLQAQRTNQVGASTTANVLSDAVGRTTLRFVKVA